MRRSVLPLVRCPRCGRELRLGAVGAESAGHVLEGELVCGCSARYPVRRGIPRLLPSVVAQEAESTAARFGEQWKTFTHAAAYEERWLKGWLALGPAEIRGKVIFEGGCGKGRHSAVIGGQWGAKELVAVDLGDAVEVAFARTRELPNVHIVQGDLERPPVPRAFDAAFSVGVLHHMPDPRAGFDALSRVVRPGGRVAIWVYGYESNEWIVKYVNPVRERVTARMPVRMLYWLTLPPAAVLQAASQLYRSRALRDRLPYGAYLSELARVPLREVHNILFDQLVTPLAVYLPEREVRSWFEGSRFRDVEVSWHRRNSWRASATVVG